MSPQASLLRLRTGLTVLVGVLLFLLAIPAVGWQLGLPWIGVALEPSAGGRPLVTAVDSGSTAASLGVRPGDTLLAVGRFDAPAEGADRIDLDAFRHHVANAYREGDEAAWTVKREGRRLSLTGPFEGVPDSRVVSRAVVLGVFWLIAWFLLWARPDRKNARHLVYTIFAMTASVLFILNRAMALDTLLGFTVVQVSNLGLFVAPALVVHFGVIFPVSPFSDRVRRRLLYGIWGFYFLAVYVVMQALVVRGLLSADAPYLLMPEVLEAVRYGELNVWLHVGDFVVCAGLILWTYWRVEEEEVRDQIKWVLWAVGLTAALDTLGMGAVLYADGVGFSDLYPYRNYLYLLIAAGLVVAIFRHDLFDVDRVIRGTVVYFGTAGLLFALFAATEALVSRALTEWLPTRSETLGTASAAVMAGALFQPLRGWIQARMLELLPVDPEEEIAADV